MTTREPDPGRTFRGTAGRLLDGFLRPHPAGAVAYRRAVGFFSSSAFTAADPEFGECFARGGVIELVYSLVLSWADVRAINDGLGAGHVWVGRPIGAVLRQPPEKRATELLSRAVANRQLGIKIAGGAAARRPRSTTKNRPRHRNRTFITQVVK